MAKRGKKAVKRGASRMKKARKSQKTSRARRGPSTVSLIGKAKVMKTPEELEVLRKRFARRLAAGAAGACFFKDPSGGPDQCIPATQEDCKSEGGVWSPGNCPA
jgi:hypothetical protein